MVGTALSQSFEVLFRNIVPFGIIALLMTLPIFLLNLLTYQSMFDMQQTAMDPESLNDPAALDTYMYSVKWTFIYSGIGMLLYSLAWALATAAMSYGTYESLRGQPARLGQCLQKGLPLVIPAIIITILWTLAISASMFLLVIPAIILAMMWYVIVPVTVVERPGIFAAFGRSAELTRGNRWRVFGISLVALAIGWAINLPLAVISLIFPGNAGVIAVFAWIAAAASLIVSAVVVAVVYYYLRIAKEGGSIQDIAAVFD